MLLSEKPFIQQVWLNDDGEVFPLVQVQQLLPGAGSLAEVCDLHSLASSCFQVRESNSPFSRVELYNHPSLSSWILLVCKALWAKAFTLDALHI